MVKIEGISRGNFDCSILGMRGVKMTENFDYKAVRNYMGWVCSMCLKSISPKLDECLYCNRKSPVNELCMSKVKPSSESEKKEFYGESINEEKIRIKLKEKSKELEQKIIDEDFKHTRQPDCQCGCRKIKEYTDDEFQMKLKGKY